MYPQTMFWAKIRLSVTFLHLKIQVFTSDSMKNIAWACYRNVFVHYGVNYVNVSFPWWESES